MLTGLLVYVDSADNWHFMSFVICISYGNTKVVHIGINLLAAMGISFLCTALVCLCAMITGQLVSCSGDVCGCQFCMERLVAIANVSTYVSYGLPYMEFVRKISVTWFATNVAASQSQDFILA